METRKLHLHYCSNFPHSTSITRLKCLKLPFLQCISEGFREHFSVKLLLSLINIDLGSAI